MINSFKIQELQVAILTQLVNIAIRAYLQINYARTAMQVLHKNKAYMKNFKFFVY